MRLDALFVTIAPVPAVIVLVFVGLPETWRPIHVVGLALVVVGLALLTLARLQLGSAFSITPQATTLVTRGLYARIRNPVYVFGFVLIGGLMLYANRPQLLLLLGPIAVLQTVRARREAKVLEERFGDAYRAYRVGTWF
jgi:protein-S-isoprenylcysteine O-methyltransferase Ste14